MIISDFYDDLTARLRASGDWIWPLVLRLLLGFEFYRAGLGKLNGNNWFADRIDNFPVPFKWLGGEFSWFAATWGELIFSAMLVLGLFTRFAAFSLLVITTVAIFAVHWPESWSSLSELWNGYTNSDDGAGTGDYRIPLLFISMMLPLIFAGGGKFSVDALLRLLTARAGDYRRIGDLQAAGIALLVVATPFIFLIPVLGFVLLGMAALCFLIPRFS